MSQDEVMDFLKANGPADIEAIAAGTECSRASVLKNLAKLVRKHHQVKFTKAPGQRIGVYEVIA